MQIPRTYEGYICVKKKKKQAHKNPLILPKGSESDIIKMVEFLIATYLHLLCLVDLFVNRGSAFL
jgi:hypothetical protein